MDAKNYTVNFFPYKFSAKDFSANGFDIDDANRVRSDVMKGHVIFIYGSDTASAYQATLSKKSRKFYVGRRIFSLQADG